MRVAIDFFATANDIIEALPRGRSKIADQLSRAALSISVNIAEAAGELSGDAKAAFYRSACRSATECAAIIDAGKRTQLVQEPLATRGRGQLLRVVSMLVKLCGRHHSP